MFNVNIRLSWTSFIIYYRISVLLYRAYILLYRAWILPYCFVCLNKNNNVLDTVLQLEFSVICGIRLFKLCPLLWLRMTCSCISFYVVYLLNLPFRSLFIPTSPRGRQRKYFFTTFTTNSPLLFVGSYCVASFLIWCQELIFYRTVKKNHLFCIYRH